MFLSGKNTILPPKLAVFGKFTAKLLFYLSFAVPKFILGICFDYFFQQNSSQSMSKREPAHFSQNDHIYHFRAKIGRLWINFGKTITLPEFRGIQSSFLGSVLTIFFSRTHHSPWASVSQLIFLKMTKYTILGPKLAVFGLISAKLSLCLSFAAP